MAPCTMTLGYYVSRGGIDSFWNLFIMAYMMIPMIHMGWQYDKIIRYYIKEKEAKLKN